MNEITNKDLQELKHQLDKWDLTFHKSCKNKIAYFYDDNENNFVCLGSEDMNHVCVAMPLEVYQDLLNWKNN